MTDKQTIINGVGVSGCEHYDEVCLGNHHYKWCKDNDNCYYKQLKRKEQECEELQNKFLELNCKAYSNSLELDQLKAENEELKAQLEQPKKGNEEFKEKLSQVKDITEPLNSELPEDKVIREIFLMVNDCINQKVNPYKQALDEIAERKNSVCDACKKFTPNRASDITCEYCEVTQIRNIIDKAKDGK